MGSRAKKVRRLRRKQAQPPKFIKVMERGDVDEASFAASTATRAAQLVTITEEVDRIVAELAALVSQFEPLGLLQQSHGWFIADAIGKEAEHELGYDSLITLRMLDYVQSVVCATPPAPTQRTASSDDWNMLRGMVSELYNWLQLPYFIAATSARRLNDPQFDEAVEQIRTPLEMHFLTVRSERYFAHEVPRLRRFLLPHDEILRELFGVGADEIADGLERLQESLASGVLDGFNRLKELQGAFVADLGDRTVASTDAPDLTPREAFEQFLERSGKRAEWESALGRTFGLDAFDVDAVTGLPAALLDELSWSPGEDTTFFAPGDRAGWPLRQLPIHKRPFLRIGARHYCFDQVSLFDGTYRNLERLVKRLRPGYGQTWKDRQAAATEEFALELFSRLLPGATIHRSAHYQFDNPTTGKREWSETDGVVVYAGHLFVVEVKAGLYVNLSPVEAFDQHVASMKRLIAAPASQGERFLAELRVVGAITLHDADHNPITTIDLSTIRRATVVGVTLDNLSAIGTRAVELAAVGAGVGRVPTWPLSLDDLLVYAEVFSSPFRFLHFVEQRMRAELDHRSRPEDELDHLGMYLESNRYAKEVESLEPHARVLWAGYRGAIDRFYPRQGTTPERAIRPEQPRHGFFDDLIDKLEASGGADAARLASLMLDLPFEHRQGFDKALRDVLLRVSGNDRVVSFAAGGDVPLTTVCLPPSAGAAQIAEFRDRTRADMLLREEETRAVLFVRARPGRDSTEVVGWEFLLVSEIGLGNRPALERLAEKIGAERVEKVRISRPRGRIEPNEMCPCGRDRKFKHCHGRRAR